MKSSSASLRAAALGGVCLLGFSSGAGRMAVAPAYAAGAKAAAAAAPVAATAAAAATAPIAVSVGFQAAVPSTGVVHHRIEPADGSIALARQAHQAPLLIVLGVAPGQAKLVLEYGDGHSETRAIAVTAGPPAGTESLHIAAGKLQPGRAAMGLKSFSAATSGIIEVKVAPNNQDYIIRALKPGKTSVLLIQDDSSTQQKIVEVTP